MTEKDKMISGELYDATDPELGKDRERVKELCFDYNMLRPSDTEKQRKLLHEIIGKMGENITILPSFWCDYGYNIEIGNNFFSNHNLTILDCAKVTFGDNVFIGPNSGFYTAGHPFDPEIRRVGIEYAKPITVGNDVWIGAGVHVMPGVSIGNNVVIGAGSVVTKDIEDDSVALGNPCKVVKKIDGKQVL